MSDHVPIRPDVLRSIADTLEARADANEPLAPAELRSLAITLNDLATGHDPFGGNPALAAKATITSLRPLWRGPPQGS